MRPLLATVLCTREICSPRIHVSHISLLVKYKISRKKDYPKNRKRKKKKRKRVTALILKPTDDHKQDFFFTLTLSIPLCQIGSKLHSTFVTQKCRSLVLCPRSAKRHYAHLGGNHYVNSALFWQCCLNSYQKARARGFK